MFVASAGAAGWQQVPGSNNQIQVYEDKKTWAQAKLFCEGEHARLALPTSQAEFDFFESLMGKEYYFIGATDAAEDGKWVDLDNNPLAWANWFSGYGIARSAGGKFGDCAEIHPNNNKMTQTWCSRKRKFICQKDPTHPAWCNGAKVGDFFNKDCSRCECKQNGVSCVACSTFVPKDGCTQSAQDNSKDYPQCCPKEVCPVIKRVIVEVSGQKNSESSNAECKIGFPGGSSATFTSAGGSVFHRGNNETFSVSGTGYVNIGLKLKCQSPTNDALNVDKLYAFTPLGWYVSDVRTVFDDVTTCNTKQITGRAGCSAPLSVANCCHDEVDLNMVPV